ncbi:Arm DNA-binding domain-containing protein [Carnobacterium maltaromaticum]|uniref:Arm DNA-binding domain-containing protein n=1 Tax=Carnobacterium maltaromaticum TaxID=2751 RepID=A0AAW9JVV6_CARML|nr:Arm DNA-binding domain-containing protein [Carnobacterium maltaromaticum]MDZ5757785.1 Arm DNA-binding domain-containing protein [Carnobacterium maltaromaticum]
MVKINNIYQDKKTKKWFFRVYLGTDIDGKKIQKTKRGYGPQREAKRGYDQYMLTHGFHQTLTSHLSSASQMTFEEFYRMRIRDISSQDVEDWMHELSQTATRNSRKQEEITTLSRNYINRILGHLRIILNRAVKEGLIERNPVDSVPYFPKENKKVEFWDIKEFQNVMAMIPENSIQNQHRKIIYEMLFYIGLRIGELQALSWENVNFEKN